MVDIPPEIIPDILRRLPAKSLGRFKAVSKSWLSLISQPQFIKDHLNTVKLTRLICDINEGPIVTLPHPLHNEGTPKLSLFFPSTDLYFFISHGSCNGLVLGSVSYSFAHNPRGVSDRLVILNPTTKEFIELSETHYETLEYYTNHSCGIGYDCVTDDYKVVTLDISAIFDLPIYMHIYSLKTNTWRRVPDYPYPYGNYNDSFDQEKVLLNECLHWIAPKRIDDTFLQVIVGFSLADEEFCEVPSPDWGNDVDMRVCKLVAFGEKLGIFVGDGVWLMNDYGVRKSWSKITINGFIDISRMYYKYDKPLIHFEDGKILLVSKRLLQVYDVEEECFINTVDMSEDLKGFVNGTYVESLVSLKSISTLIVHKLTNSRPVTPQDAIGRGGGRDDGTSGGRERGGGRGGGRDGGTSGGRGRGGGRGGGRDGGISGGRGRSGGRDGGTSGRGGRSGARGRFGGGGRDSGRGGSGSGGRGRY